MCETVSCHLAMIFIEYPVGTPAALFAFGFLSGLLVVAVIQSPPVARLLARRRVVSHG